MKENNSPRKRTDKEKSANEDPITGQQVNIDAHTHEVDYLKSIIETQEELVVRFSLNGQVQFVNQAFCNLVGISHEKLIGRNLSSIFSFQSFPGLQQELTAMLAHPKRMILEDIVQHDGVKKWIQWTGFPIIARDNSIEVIQAVGHDITSLKRAEETIKVQRDLAMLLAESKNESIDYEKLGKIFSSLSSFSLFSLYLFDAGKSSYELMNQNSVFSSDIKLLKNVKRNSKLGKLFQKTGTQYIRSTETEFKSILPILDPSLKGLGVLPIRLENSLFAAVIFGSAEFTELPTEIYTQLCAISKQLENFFIQLQTRSELYRHESDLTELFRSLEQMMLVIDRQGVVLDANRVLFDKLSDGKPKKELTIFDLHPAEYADLIRAAIDETIQQQHSILTLPFSDNENNQINVEVNFSYTSWKGSNKIIAVYKDISQQMCLRVMESEQREFASNLVAIAGTFNSSLDLDIILDHVIESVDKVVPISTANILLVDANQNGRVIRQRGYDRMGTEEVFTYRVFDLQKIKTFASMLASKQECLVSDTRAYPEWVPMPESFWVRSFISAPIVIKGKIYAFLNCDHATPGYFTEKHAARLKLLADQAAIAIENANVHFETKNRLRQIALVNELTQTMLNSPQPDDLLHTLSQKILDVFDAHSIMITQWLPETQTVTQLMSFGEGILPNLPKSFSFEDASITEYVISSKQALVINTEEEYQVWQKKVSRIFNDRVVMALPLIASDWPFGAILIGFNEPRQITPTEVSLGEYVSMQIATILNKSEIYQKAQLQSAQFEHANDLIASLSYVATTIMSAKGLNDTIQTMGDGLEKMNIHSFLFFKVSDEYLSLDFCSRNEQLLAQLKSFDFIPRGKIKLPLPDADEFRLTLNQQQIVFIDNPGQLLKSVIPSRLGPFVNKFQDALDIHGGTKSLFLPLIVENKTIGLLGLYGENLQEIDQKAGEIFNSQISVALENARLIAEVQRLAITDELTSVNNRRGLFDKGNRELAIAKRLSHPLAALMIDLDNFKDVNDKFGHAVGDIALREIARRIAKSIRDIDLLGRYGGEEFVVLLVGDDLSEAMKVAERINQAIGTEEIQTEAGPIRVTVSIGVDELDSMTANLGMLIKRADRALYVAKHNGRNQVATLTNIENLDSQKGSIH